MTGYFQLFFFRAAKRRNSCSHRFQPVDRVVRWSSAGGATDFRRRLKFRADRRRRSKRLSPLRGYSLRTRQPPVETGGYRNFAATRLWSLDICWGTRNAKTKNSPPFPRSRSEGKLDDIQSQIRDFKISNWTVARGWLPVATAERKRAGQQPWRQAQVPISALRLELQSRVAAKFL